MIKISKELQKICFKLLKTTSQIIIIKQNNILKLYPKVIMNITNVGKVYAIFGVEDK